MSISGRGRRRIALKVARPFRRASGGAGECGFRRSEVEGREKPDREAGSASLVATIASATGTTGSAEERFDRAGDCRELTAGHGRAIIGDCGGVISDGLVTVFHGRDAHAVASVIDARSRRPADQQRRQREHGKKRAEQTTHGTCLPPRRRKRKPETSTSPNAIRKPALQLEADFRRAAWAITQIAISMVSGKGPACHAGRLPQHWRDCFVGRAPVMARFHSRKRGRPMATRTERWPENRCLPCPTCILSNNRTSFLCQ